MNSNKHNLHKQISNSFSTCNTLKTVQDLMPVGIVTRDHVIKARNHSSQEKTKRDTMKVLNLSISINSKPDSIEEFVVRLRPDIDVCGEFPVIPVCSHNENEGEIKKELTCPSRNRLVHISFACSNRRSPVNIQHSALTIENDEHRNTTYTEFIC